MDPSSSQRLYFVSPFESRPPSVEWEAVRFPDSPQHYVWAWYKPQAAPDTVMITVPDETWATYPGAGLITARKLLFTVGIDPACVHMWYLYGLACASDGGASPLLDQPLPPPAAGGDPRITAWVRPSQPAAWPPQPAVAVTYPAMAAAPAASGPAAHVFTRIESDWNAILQIEANLALLRKQVAATLGRINALNRDLSPDERQYGDRKDKSDWQIARRWLRDVASRLSRCIKDHDMGHTSAAGKRNQFEQTYRQFIEPRIPFDRLERMQRDFEQYRKSMQTLLGNMQTANVQAGQDGERRAQEILNRLASKVRAARTRR